jgi:hypothetical protein
MADKKEEPKKTDDAVATPAEGQDDDDVWAMLMIPWLSLME